MNIKRNETESEDWLDRSIKELLTPYIKPVEKDLTLKLCLVNKVKLTPVLLNQRGETTYTHLKDFVFFYDDLVAYLAEGLDVFPALCKDIKNNIVVPIRYNDFKFEIEELYRDRYGDK